MTEIKVLVSTNSLMNTEPNHVFSLLKHYASKYKISMDDIHLSQVYVGKDLASEMETEWYMVLVSSDPVVKQLAEKCQESIDGSADEDYMGNYAYVYFKQLGRGRIKKNAYMQDLEFEDLELTVADGKIVNAESANLMLLGL